MKRILIISNRTGDGKSTLGNSILGLHDTDPSAFQTSDNLESVYNTNLGPITKKTGRFFGSHDQVEVLDTAGFSDTNFRDEQILRGLYEFLGTKEGLTCVVVVFKVTETKFDADFKRALEYVAAMCGPSVFERTLFVSTMWNVLNTKRQQEKRQIVKAEWEPALKQHMQSLSTRPVHCSIIEFHLDEPRQSLKSLLDFSRTCNTNFVPSVSSDFHLIFNQNPGASIETIIQKAKDHSDVVRNFITKLAQIYNATLIETNFVSNSPVNGNYVVSGQASFSVPITSTGTFISGNNTINLSGNSGNGRMTILPNGSVIFN